MITLGRAVVVRLGAYAFTTLHDAFRPARRGFRVHAPVLSYLFFFAVQLIPLALLSIAAAFRGEDRRSGLPLSITRGVLDSLFERNDGAGAGPA